MVGCAQSTGCRTSISVQDPQTTARRVTSDPLPDELNAGARIGREQPQTAGQDTTRQHRTPRRPTHIHIRAGQGPFALLRGSRIRTSVGIHRWIYSPLHTTAGNRQPGSRAARSMHRLRRRLPRTGAWSGYARPVGIPHDAERPRSSLITVSR